MYRPIQIKTTTRNSTSHLALRGLFLIPLVFMCLGLSPALRAVNPPPDGGYPGFNTAEGTSALFNLTSGINDTALGYQALFHNTTGTNNTGVGFRSLFSNTTGVQNTATGINALSINTTGSFNTAFGVNSLAHSTTGSNSTAVGVQALFANTSGAFDNAFGFQALFSNTTGFFNNAHGRGALKSNVDGSQNNAFGDLALTSNTTGGTNTGIGDDALFSVTTGNSNTALGDEAGSNLIDGEGNIYIGAQVQAGATDELEFIRIGDDNAFAFPYDTFIAGIYGRGAGPAPLTVMCGSNGKLSANASSRRFKHDIKPIDKASEAILALKPVSFRYNNDSTNTPWFGLIAEDVAQVSEDLIVRDKEGKPFSVRYDQVNAILLSEFLKEHKKVEKQQASIADLKSAVAQQQKGMEVLTAQLKEQAAQIQKVSAQLELNKRAPRTVANK